MTGIAEPSPALQNGLQTGASRSLAALATIWVVSVAYVGSRITRDWTPHDEGLLAQTAARLLAGQLPHRDFGDAYTGLLTAYHAMAFAAGGQSLFVLRIALLVAFALWVPAFYGIALRFVSPWGAALATAAAVVWSVPNYSASMPTWYNLFLTTAGTLAVIRYLESHSRRWLALAGVCAALSILVKIVGIYFVLAVVLFLYWRSLDAGGIRTDAGPALPPRRWMRAGVAGVAAMLLSLTLVGLVWRGITSARVVHFVVPGAAVGIIIAVTGARPRAAQWSMLSRELLAFSVGIAAPLALFLIPYVAGHAVHPLITGVLVLPLRRLVSAQLPPPGLHAAARVLPVAVGLWLTSASSEKARFALTLLALPVGVAALLLSTRGWMYIDIVNAARAAIPITCCAAAVLLIRRPNPARSQIDRERAALLVFVAAFSTLIQFPFAPAVYFCYIAPLALLAIIAVTVGLSRRGPSGVGAMLLAFAVCFAVLRMNTRAYDTLGRARREPKPDALLPLPRGGVHISSGDSATYTQLVATIRPHTTGDYMFCTPDCPEAYFLAGLQNPTATIFEFLDDPPIDVATVIRALDDHRVTVVAVNRQARFSLLDTALARELRRRYPDSLRVDYFTVRWR
jgi:Dolichyl-phosphate-mannose-protein mannosyltransferase